MELNVCLIFPTTFGETFLILRISQPGAVVRRCLGEVTVIIFRLY